MTKVKAPDVVEGDQGDVDDSDANELDAVQAAEAAPSADVSMPQVIGHPLGFAVTAGVPGKDAPLQVAKVEIPGLTALGDSLGQSTDQLAADLQTLVVNAIQGLLNDSSVDLSKYLPDIGTDMVEAVKTGDTAMQKELVNQLKAVAELSRLKADAELMDLFQAASAKIMEVAVAAARLALQTALGAKIV